MRKIYAILCALFLALNVNAASDNQITMSYADGKIDIKTTNSDPYFFFIETQAEYDSYNPDYSQKWINEELATWIGIEEYNKRITEFVVEGDQTIDVDEFWSTHRKGDVPSGSFIALAAGYENKVLTTEGSYLLFEHSSTPIVDDTPQSFDIVISELTPVSATVNITPANKTQTYYFSIMPAAELSGYNGVEEIAETYRMAFDEMIAYYEQTVGSILTYRSFLYDGPAIFSYGDLTPNTEYVVVAFGFDAETALPTTELFTQPFTTEDAVMSDNELTMSYTDGVINITTTNNDPYFFIFELEEEYYGFVPDLSESSLKEEINNWMELVTNYGMEDRLLHKGDTSIDLPEFWSTYLSQEPMGEGDYIAICGGFNTIVNTAPKFLLFHYGEEDGITNIRMANPVVHQKILENGQIIIKNGNKKYNTRGQSAIIY